MFLAEVLKCKQKEETNRSNSWSEICVAKLLVFFLVARCPENNKALHCRLTVRRRTSFQVHFKEAVSVGFAVKENLQCIISECVAATTAAVLEVQ